MPTQKLTGFVHNPRIPEAEALVNRLVDALGLRGSAWVAPAEALNVGEETIGSTSTVIVAGGDGTILRVAQLAAPHSVPILGINMGRVGFMTELTVDDAPTKIPLYLDGSARVEERMMIQASVALGGEGSSEVTLHALNDVVVNRGPAARLLDIEARIDGVPLTSYRADGVIVATATGSTSYSLAAGGPVLYPEAQMMLIQPVAAHMSFETGVVASGDSVIELRVGGAGEAVLSADVVTHSVLGPRHTVVVRRSPHVARFLRAGGPADFFASLDRRLGVTSRPSQRERMSGADDASR